MYYYSMEKRKSVHKHDVNSLFFFVIFTENFRKLPFFQVCFIQKTTKKPIFCWKDRFFAIFLPAPYYFLFLRIRAL